MVIAAILLQSMVSPSAGEPPQLGSWSCRASGIENDDLPRLRLRIALSWNLPQPPGEEPAIAIIWRSSSLDYPVGRYHTRFIGTDRFVRGRPWFEMYIPGHSIRMSNFDYARGRAELEAGPLGGSGDVSGPIMAYRGRCRMVR